MVKSLYKSFQLCCMALLSILASYNLNFNEESLFVFTKLFRALKITVYNQTYNKYLINKITVFTLTDNTHQMLFVLNVISLQHLPLITPHTNIVATNY